MADVIIYPSEHDGPVRVMSPEGRVISPDILKRIIEGHEATDVFEECLGSQVYDEKADVLVRELSKYIRW